MHLALIEFYICFSRIQIDAALISGKWCARFKAQPYFLRREWSRQARRIAPFGQSAGQQAIRLFQPALCDILARLLERIADVGQLTILATLPAVKSLQPQMFAACAAAKQRPS